MPGKGFSIVILAAGKATRFKSERSKLLHPLAGRPLGEYLLRTAAALEPHQIFMVIGHDGEEVRKTFGRPGVTFIEQGDQLGTGHALLVAQAELQRCATPAVLVLVGDVPLLRHKTLHALLETYVRAKADATVLTTRLENPSGYGRIIRKGNRITAIVEEKVATAAQRKIREISSGLLCFSRQQLLKYLGELSNANAQREYLLTDLIAIFARHRLKVTAFPVADPQEVMGVNDRVELARVERILHSRKAETLMHNGVTIVDPEATYVDEDVEVGPDSVIEPGVSLLGTSRAGRQCLLRAWSTITDSVLGDRVTVRPCSVISGCQIASDVVIGPFAHLRDGAVIEPHARIGNFVEVKKSVVGRGSKAQHLTYLGDATLGADVNIGAGTVTCNYDGQRKHPTIIEDRCFIGSGSMLVAPVRIGKGSSVGAGSTITEDVPPDSLALGRARQVNKEGWFKGHGKAKSASVAVRQVGSVTVIDVAGPLTLGQAAKELREKVLAARQAGLNRVVVNLAEATYVDSSGLGELVGAMAALRHSGGELKLAGISGKVLALFKETSLSQVLEIHPHEAAALASFGER